MTILVLASMPRSSRTTATGVLKAATVPDFYARRQVVRPLLRGFALLPREMQDDLAAVRPVAVLDEIKALPGAEREPAVDDRDRDGGVGQHRPDMGRHVVRAFRTVHITRV